TVTANSRVSRHGEWSASTSVEFDAGIAVAQRNSSCDFVQRVGPGIYTAVCGKWNRTGLVCVKLGMDMECNIAARVDLADSSQSWITQLVVCLLLRDFALTKPGRAVIHQFGVRPNPARSG
ncbi:MAG: hypothetical protein QME72_05500, partial [Rhodococcus sp. (in: high G+C Gram-positive bacteria)]